jgi:TolB protein
MTQKFQLAPPLLRFLGLACTLLQALGQTTFDAVVDGKATALVPIALSGYSGEVERVLKFDLEVAGFSIVSGDKAQLTLNGKNGAQVEGTLLDQGKRSLFARAYPGGNPRLQAHALADDVVQAAISGQKGIARTKIAFKHEAGRRNAHGETVSEVFMSDYDGANPFQLTQDGTISRSPAWKPGHRTLFYTSFKPGRPCIFSHDLASGARSPVSNFNGMNDGAAISPDGSRMAMVLSRSGSPDIWVSNLDGSGLRQLTKTREAESSPCWSPDGRTLCYASSEGGGSRLMLIDAGGGTPRMLQTGGIRGATEPDWSPDGRWIAFTRMGGGENFELYMVPANGGTAKALGAGEDPSWAPNSRTLAVVRRRGSTRKLSLLDAFTGQAKDLQTISGSCGQPSWAR